MSYSQHKQDLWVINQTKGKRDGFFLDSGAADGTFLSNTKLLEEKYGWTGICAEPNRTYFDILKDSRSCHCYNVCLYNENTTIDFHEEGMILGGIPSEYSAQHKNRALSENSLNHLNVVTCEARKIEDLLVECDAPTIIDYWSLDTEGSELLLLKCFPWDRYSVGVITVEHNWEQIRRAEIRQFLNDRGFTCVGSLDCDDCYVKGV